ncbi:site-specific integrase [Lachnospiraceae bacterium LCP25S3_G4]
MAKAKKLPSGQWRTLVYSHTEKSIDKDGKTKDKRIYESFTADTKKESEYLAAEFSLNKSRLEKYDFTVKEAMLKYVESKKDVISPTTIRGYNTLIKNAFNEIDGTKTKKLTQEDVQIWVNNYSKNHSPKTVNNAHGFLSSVLSIYEPKLKLRTKLPMAVRPALYTPSDSDIKTLLKYVSGTELEKAILLASFGAMRRGEICALTDKDINGNIIKINKSMVRNNNGGFIIKSPKTLSSFREVDMPEFVIDKFKDTKGRLVNMHPEDISKVFGSILKSAGLPHFRFHDLRHYSASIMHAIGIPDQYIMARGGWKTDRVLKQVYRNVIEEENKKFNQKINSHFESMQHEMQHKK